jgi:hypothetical protein
MQSLEDRIARLEQIFPPGMKDVVERCRLHERLKSDTYETDPLIVRLRIQHQAFGGFALPPDFNRIPFRGDIIDL